MDLDDAIHKLHQMCDVKNVHIYTIDSAQSSFDTVRALATARYLEKLRDGEAKMMSSALVADCVYGMSSKARLIRRWATQILSRGEFTASRQGKKAKILCILDNLDNRALLLAKLRAMQARDRHPREVTRMLCDKWLAEMDDAPESVTVSTAWRWMRLCGFSVKVSGKSYYTDCHEREDIVDYRARFCDEITAIGLVRHEFDLEMGHVRVR